MKASTDTDAVRPTGIANKCPACLQEICADDNSFAVIECGMCKEKVHSECFPQDNMDACNRCAREKRIADKKGRKKERIKLKKEEKGLNVMDDEEARDTKGLPCGVKPSDKEIEDHERTHLPFRS